MARGLALNLVQLRYFKAVVDLRSLTTAARALNVSQPAVTRQIRLLEEELGVSLLLRHRRGVEPTDVGVRLAQEGEALLKAFLQLSDDVKAEKGQPSGTLRVGFPPSVSRFLIGATIGAFGQKYPRVSVQLVEGFSPHLAEWLVQDKLDLAVMSAQNLDQKLFAIPFYTEQVWVILKGDQTPVRRYSLSELSAHRLIQTGRSNVMRLKLERAAATLGLHLDVAVEVDSLALIKDLVNRGVGAHISPYSSFAEDIEVGTFIGGPVEDLTISRVLVQRKDRPTTKAAIEMIRLFQGELVSAERYSHGAIRIDEH